MSLGSCRFQRIGGLAPMCHQAVAASVDWRTCTWPNAYDVPTMPQRLSRSSGARQRRRGRCTSSAIVSGGPRGADRLFRRGPIRSNHAAPTTTRWWGHARGLAQMACQRAPAPLTYQDGARQRPMAGASSSASDNGGPRGSGRLFSRGPTRSDHAAPTSIGLVGACTWSFVVRVFRSTRCIGCRRCCQCQRCFARRRTRDVA